MKKRIWQHIVSWIFWFRYPLLFVGVLVGIIFLLWHIIPDLDHGPDEELFFSLQKPLIHILGSDEISMLDIVDMSWTQHIDARYQQELSLNNDLNNRLEFRFASKGINEHTPIVLEWYEGTQFFLFPQSDLLIQQSTSPSTKFTVKIKQWDVGIALSSYAQKQQLFDLDPRIKILSGNIQIYQNFMNRKYNFFVDEAGGVFFENRTLNNFLEYYLTLLFNLDAERFGQKLLNFQAYQNYLYRSGEKLSYFKNDFNGWFSKWSIKRSIQKKWSSAWEQTKIKQWLNRF